MNIFIFRFGVLYNKEGNWNNYLFQRYFNHWYSDKGYQNRVSLLLKSLLSRSREIVEIFWLNFFIVFVTSSIFGCKFSRKKEIFFRKFSVVNLWWHSLYESLEWNVHSAFKSLLSFVILRHWEIQLKNKDFEPKLWRNIKSIKQVYFFKLWTLYIFVMCEKSKYS